MEKVTRGQQAKNRLDEIKFLLKTGKVDYDTAKDMANEPLKIMNEEMAKIAKKHGFKPRKVGFTGFMR